MAKSAKDVQAFFERVATDWDTMRLAYYDESVIEKMAKVAGIGEGSEVADVGTGTGFVAAGLAPRVKRVIGIDNASAMLRVARENLDSLSVSNAELLVGDLAGLPLADNSVDAAFANMVLHHAVDPAAMLKEMARIVRPGGMIVITDEVEHPYEWMREEHADVWLGFTPEQVESYFSEARLADFGYVFLGMQ
jgi:ubiquinone/menaquinone biosynthesis C-methylase UbiE